MGVQGDTQVVAWSDATIDGVAMDESFQLSVANRTELSNECKRKSQKLVTMKGKAPLGMASVILSICSSILADKRDIKSVSHFHPEWDCCFSFPAVLGRGGILDTLQKPLNKEERDQLIKSVTALKATIDRIIES